MARKPRVTYSEEARAAQNDYIKKKCGAKTIREMADYLGVSYPTVASRIRRMGLKPSKGELHSGPVSDVWEPPTLSAEDLENVYRRG